MIKNKTSSSSTVAINTLALERKQRKEPVYNFAAGDPVILNHPAISKAAVVAAEARLSPYAPIMGLPELRLIAANWINSTYATQFGMENTLVTCGGKFALFAALQLMLEAKDEVLIPSPFWTSYPALVRLFHAEVKTIAATEKSDWKIDAESLKRALTPRSRVLILNNACNPTGALYSKEELEALLKVAAETDLSVISDEVYSGIVYDDKKFISCGAFPEHKERVLVVQSCSKNFGMTGWRVGFAFGPKDLIAEMGALQSQSTTGTSILSQWAAIGALKNAEEVMREMQNIMQKRRDLFIKTFNQLFACNIPKPASAIYAFIPLSAFGIQGNNCTQVAEAWIKDVGVACVPGSAFGMPGYIRFAFTESEEVLVEGLKALRKVIA